MQHTYCIKFEKSKFLKQNEKLKNNVHIINTNPV